MNFQRQQRLEIRYPQNPQCVCGNRAKIRVVETPRNGNQGKLYYCCLNPSCRSFVAWVTPENVTWVPSGVRVAPPMEEPVGMDEIGEVDFRVPAAPTAAPTAPTVASSVSNQPWVRPMVHNETGGNAWMVCCMMMTVILAIVVFFK